MISLINPDGDNGTVNNPLSISSTSGGLFSYSAVAPTIDSNSGSGDWQTGGGSGEAGSNFTHKIKIDGAVGFTLKDLLWDLLINPELNGGSWNDQTGAQPAKIYINVSDSGTYTLANDQAIFDSPENYNYTYTLPPPEQSVAVGVDYYHGLALAATHSETFSSIKFTSVGTSVSQEYKSLAINYTLGGDTKDLIVDLTGLTTGTEIQNKINTELGITVDSLHVNTQGNSFVKSTDGFRCEFFEKTVGSYVEDTLHIANYENATINSAVLTKGDPDGGNLITDTVAITTTTVEFDQIYTVVDGTTQSTTGYDPSNLNAPDEPYINNTNISRYAEYGSADGNEHFAFSGANDPNFVEVDAGYKTGGGDLDIISFYAPTNTGSDPTYVSSDPNANGDYDLVTSNAYIKIENIEIIDAVGYGTNNIQLHKTAIGSMATEIKQKVWVESYQLPDTSWTVAGWEGDIGWTIAVKGDAADTVTLTDESSWSYGGIIEGASTISQYGNILYQFIISEAQNSPQTWGTDAVTLKSKNHILNVSATIGTHPDWYFSGTAGDDAYELPDTQFGSVDFGTGTDTLEIHSGLATKTQDFTGEGGDLANVEIINFTNTYVTDYSSQTTAVSVDTIIVDKTFVSAATDSNNILNLIGDNEDNVTITNNATEWTFVGQVDSTTSNTGNLTDYTFYQYQTEDGIKLYIKKEMTDNTGIYYNGWAGDDIIRPFDTSYDGIDGGSEADSSSGTDKLGFNVATQNYATTLTNISNIEVIDGTVHTGNTTITLDKTSVTNMTDSNNTLAVFGDAGDTVVLSDLDSNWSWIGKVSGINGFVGMQFYQYQSLDGTATLNIHDTITSRPAVYAIGDIGNSQRDDVLLLEDMNFAKVDGKLGTDTLVVDDVGTLDFSAVTTVANIEVIDISDTASGVTTSASSIKVSEDFVYNGTDADNGLLLLGDSGDTLSFLDASQWSYAGYLAAGGDWPAIHAYQATSNSQTVTLYADSDFGGPMVDAKGSTGNDVINVKNKEDVNIDGQSGFDTLTTSGDTAAIDLTSGKTVQGIDLINITNSSAESLTFNAAAVDASDNDTIYVQGDSTDTVNGSSGDNWVLTGRANFDNAPDMYIYQADNSGNTVSLYVQTDLLQSSLYQTPGGSSADDILKVKDTAFGSLDGSSGFDRLLFLQQGDVDLSNLAGGNTLSSIEAIDTTNGVSNSLTVDADLVAQINSGNDLYVMGDSSDSLDLSGWTAGGSTVMNSNLTWNSYTSTASGGETVTVYADSQVTATT